MTETTGTRLLAVEVTLESVIRMERQSATDAERNRVTGYLRWVAAGDQLPSKLARIAVEQLADAIEGGAHVHR